MDQVGISQLFSQDQLFAQCVQSCSEPVMVTDLKGRLIYVNEAWSRAYGYSAQEALGQTPSILRSEHQDSQFYQKMWSKITDPRIGYWKGELVNKAKDGQEVPVLLTVTPYRSRSGEVLGYMGIALDLTEQKYLQAQVEQQDRLATIGVLTSGMAHEVGTPIGVIRGRAEMLLMDAEGDENLKKNLDIIIKQTDRISGFIGSLLKLSRSNSADLELDILEIRPVVDEVLDLLAPKIRKNKIEVEVNLEEGMVAFADDGRLEQVLINLMVNAVHAIEKKLERDDSAEKNAQYIRVLGRRTVDRAEITIEDSGCGIAPENLKKVFEPFFTTKPTGQGTGLGLSIVNRIINEMSGTIFVESTEGKGTRFTFTLQLPQIQ